MRRPQLHWTKLLLLLGVSALSCDGGDYTHLYAADGHAPSVSPTDIQALNKLGPVLADRGVNFSVYAKNATKVRLLLFDTQDDALPSRQFDMTRYGDVWSVYIQGVGQGQIYGYVAWGPNWPFDAGWFPGSVKGFLSDVDTGGNRYNPNKLLFDPYSKAITRDHNWGLGTSASGPGRAQSDYAAAMKSIVYTSSYQWGTQEASYLTMRQDPLAAGHGWNELIIYEMHPKGFTMNSASLVDHPGTYLGIAEKADYLKDLGVTAVQIMPVFQKPSDGGYWGYETLNFFAPEITYSSKQGPGEPVEEFKHMVEELHKRNIEVILDVVYNHTGEGGLWREKIQYGGGTLDQTLDPRNWGNYDPVDTAGLYAYRGLDNAEYYHLDQTNPGRYDDSATGVGNETRTNNVPFARLTLDSLRYWVNEYHVDGFRFDLGTQLGGKDDQYGCFATDPSGSQAAAAQTVLQTIIDDPTLQAQNTRIIAEPWGLNCFGLGAFPASTNYLGDSWYEHNGWFRDWWRPFVNGLPFNNATWSVGTASNQPNNHNADFGFFTMGSLDLYSPLRNPYNSINFVTVHDGFTMYDLVSYDQKQNGAGPLAPDCNQPVTPFCNNDGTDDNRSHNWAELSWTQDVACGADPSCVLNKCSDGNWNSSSLWGSNIPVDEPTCRDWFCGTADNVNTSDHKGPKATCILTARAEYPQNAESTKRRIMRNLFTSMMVSRGTPMLLGGDEWMRTQLGNNNPWAPRADNEYNWYDWASWENSDPSGRMHDFVKNLVQFRKDHAYLFAATSYSGGPAVQWLSPTGGQADWSSQAIMVHYPGSPNGPELLVLVNMNADAWVPNNADVAQPQSGSVHFTLPPGNWSRLISTDSQYETVPGAVANTPQAKLSGNISLAGPPLVSDNPHAVSAQTIEVLQAD